MKKQRASLSQNEPPTFLAEPGSIGDSLAGAAISGPRADIMAQIQA